MKNIFKKIGNIRISELIIVVLIIIPLACYAVQTNVNVSVTVLPPQAPKITTIIVYPDQSAIGIQGETDYKDQVISLTDQSIGETVQLHTDDQGDFIAVLDDSSRFTQVGHHQIVALVELEREDCSHIDGGIVGYSIDEDFQVTIDPGSSQDVALSDDDISRSELKALQKQNQQIDSSVYIQEKCNGIAMVYTEELHRLAVWQWVVIIFAGLSIISLLIKRWRRKKKQGKSFWDLGNGVYCHHEQPK